MTGYQRGGADDVTVGSPTSAFGDIRIVNLEPRLQIAATVPAGLDVEIDLLKLQQRVLPDETLTIGVKTVSGTSTTTTAAITWFEEV